jgi:hypothetical protein
MCRPRRLKFEATGPFLTAALAIVIDTMGVELEPPDRLEIEQAWQRERSHFPQ